MGNQNTDDDRQRIPIRDLKASPEAEDLMASAPMQPYMQLAMAVMGRKDVGPAVEKIAALPLEERYTWRIASALKWAFTDFENLSVVADRRTMAQEDLDKLVDLLKVRPLQFCMFLAALFGEEQMERVISASVEQVKALRAQRRDSLGRNLAE